MKIFRKTYEQYNIDELLCDESYLDWVLQGKGSKNEWHQRIESQKRMRDMSRKAEIIITGLRNSQGASADPNRIESIKTKIDLDINRAGLKKTFGTYQHSNEKRLTRKIVYGMVASLSLILIFSMYMLFVNEDKVQSALEPSVEIKSTDNGQKLTVHLSDGSIVRLNSGSSIAYDKYFTDSSRIIHLKGEAFFEVARDTSRPFQVISGNSMTQALGTSFNIKTVNDEVTVALLTGKVSVSQVSGQKKKLLNPGQKTTASASGLSEVKHYEYEDEFAWKDNVLIFKNATCKEVFDKLEKWYGVNIQIQSSLDEELWNYTGKFSNKSMRYVLESIYYVEDFEFEINKKQVLIKPLTR